MRLVAFFVLCSLSFLSGENREELFLKNIRQVTFPHMGFERAGESYFSPDGKTLIFQAAGFGEKHYQIYTIHLETNELKRVSTGQGACTCGFFKPNGEKILFASSHEDPDPKEQEESGSRYKWPLTPYMNLYEANLDGSNLQRLTSGPAYHAECSYSPDGEKIVYGSNETGSMNLYIYDNSKNLVSRLTHHDHCYNGGPFFSPDGKWIVFRSDRHKKDFLQIFMIRSDGSEEKQLTDNNYVNWAPFWHPTQKFIVYTTSKHGHHAYQIYLIDLETKKQWRVTHSNTFEGLPSFSKDGCQMTWTSKRGDGLSQVFIADFVLPKSLQNSRTL